MNGADVTSTGAAQPRPWHVDTSYEFQSPTAAGLAGLHSSASIAAGAEERQVKLVFDLRVVEARRVLADDERELGPVPEDLLNEVRASWPA